MNYLQVFFSTAMCDNQGVIDRASIKILHLENHVQLLRRRLAALSLRRMTWTAAWVSLELGVQRYRALGMR